VQPHNGTTLLCDERKSGMAPKPGSLVAALGMSINPTKIAAPIFEVILNMLMVVRMTLVLSLPCDLTLTDSTSPTTTFCCFGLLLFKNQNGFYLLTFCGFAPSTWEPFPSYLCVCDL
jgi:hypothetical protein